MQDQNYCMIYLCSTGGHWFFFWHLQTFLKYEYERTEKKTSLLLYNSFCNAFCLLQLFIWIWKYLWHRSSLYTKGNGHPGCVVLNYFLHELKKVPLIKFKRAKIHDLGRHHGTLFDNTEYVNIIICLRSYQYNFPIPLLNIRLLKRYVYTTLIYIKYVIYLIA